MIIFVVIFTLLTGYVVTVPGVPGAAPPAKCQTLDAQTKCVEQPKK